MKTRGAGKIRQPAGLLHGTDYPVKMKTFDFPNGRRVRTVSIILHEMPSKYRFVKNGKKAIHGKRLITIYGGRVVMIPPRNRGTKLWRQKKHGRDIVVPGFRGIYALSSRPDPQDGWPLTRFVHGGIVGGFLDSSRSSPDKSSESNANCTLEWMRPTYSNINDRYLMAAIYSKPNQVIAPYAPLVWNYPYLP